MIITVLIIASALRTASRVDTTATLAVYITLGTTLAVSLSLNIMLILIVVVLWYKMCLKSRELSEYLQQRGKPAFVHIVCVLYYMFVVTCLFNRFLDEGIELKNNAVYGLTIPSEQFHVYGHNPESEALHTEYDYVTTNAYL